MRLFRYSWLLLFLPVLLHGQYIGSGRPWTAAQSSDSLAAVNARVDADSMRLDSLREVLGDSIQAVQAEMYDSLWARADSAFKTEMYDSLANKDPLGGGGGGGGFPYDTLAYDYFIGWHDYADEPSTYIQLTGGRADSVGGDTLLWCIDQKKTTGGKILILSGDTLWIAHGSHYDSLPTSGGITAPVYVEGIGRNKSVIGAYENYDSHPTADCATGWMATADRHWGTGNGKLAFRSINFTEPGSWTSFYGVMAQKDAQANYVLEFEDCKMRGLWFSFTQLSADSTLIFRNCELDSLTVQHYGYTLMENCWGVICHFSMHKHAELLNNELDITYILSCATGQRLHMNGGIYRLLYTTSSSILGSFIYATGVTFIFPTSGTVREVRNESYSFYKGCFFYYGGIHTDQMTEISGGGFYYSPIGVNIDAFKNSVTACGFLMCTTGIDVAGSLTDVVCHGNSGGYNTTDINGTPNVDTDNNWHD